MQSDPNKRQMDLFEHMDLQAQKDSPDYKQQLLAILSKTDDFRILERVPVTKKSIVFPYHLSDPVGDEKTIIFLDTETTGFSLDVEKIIELAMVSVSFSPSKKRLVSINHLFDEYEDPGKAIPAEIVQLAGISDEQVKGKIINDAEVSAYLKQAALVVAHNASFDRPFCEKRFKDIDTIKWACSLKGVDWSLFDISNHRQEELLHTIGYFYEAHRASIDCLALIWFMHIRQDIFANLLDNANKIGVIVHAFGAPFDAKDQLKSNGYRWNDGSFGMPKHWWKEVSDETLPQEKAFLDNLTAYSAKQASFEKVSAQERFKK